MTESIGTEGTLVRPALPQPPLAQPPLARGSLTERTVAATREVTTLDHIVFGTDWPYAALPGGGAAPGPPQGLQGVQTPNPVASALGGIVQGGIGAQNLRRDALASQMAGRITTPPMGA